MTLLVNKIADQSLRCVGKSITIACLLAMCSLTPPAVLSQASSENNDPVAIYKQAGINADQESAIRKLAQEYDQQNAVRMESLGQMLSDLKDMAYQKTLNESGMLAKQDEINKIQSEMAMQRIKLVIKIRSLLTPAQNEKLVAALQNRIRNEEQGSPR